MPVHEIPGRLRSCSPATPRPESPTTPSPEPGTLRQRSRHDPLRPEFLPYPVDRARDRYIAIRFQFRIVVPEQIQLIGVDILVQRRKRHTDQPRWHTPRATQLLEQFPRDAHDDAIGDDRRVERAPRTPRLEVLVAQLDSDGACG